MDTTARNLLIGTAIVVVAAAAGYWIYLSQASPVGPNAQTYSHAASATSFQYPEHYELTESDPTPGHHVAVLIEEGYVAPAGGEGPPALTLDIFSDAGDITPSDWVRTSTSSNFQISDGVLASSTINGHEAVAYLWDGLYRGQSFVFKNRDHILMFSVTYLSEDDSITSDFVNILRTLRLD